MNVRAEVRQSIDTSRLFGSLIFGSVLAVGLVYAAFLATRLPVFPVEQGDGAGGLAYRALHAALAQMPDPLMAGRAVAAGFFAVAIVATAAFCARATSDGPLGATLALIWIVFPPVVGLAVMSAPYSLAMAMISLALSCLWLRPEHSGRVDAAGAFAMTVAALTDPFGAWAAIACTFVIVNQRPRTWPLFGPAIGAALAVIATVPIPPVELPGLPAMGSPLVGGAALPFSLVWAGCILGAVTAFSKPVQAVLGARAIAASRIATVLYAGMVAGQAARGTTTVLIAAGVFLPFGLIGSLPLAVWVRRVMPTVRSLAAWIAFPVIMYCGFWLILGPVRHDRFPYAALPHTAVRPH